MKKHLKTWGVFFVYTLFPAWAGEKFDLSENSAFLFQGKINSLLPLLYKRKGVKNDIFIRNADS
jgi:hypothetical protein